MIESFKDSCLFCQMETHSVPVCPFILSSFHSFSFLDDIPVIDTDSDLDESEEDAEKDSGQQISDCESESLDEKQEDLPVKPTTVSELS